MNDDRPVHLLDLSTDRRTLCGFKRDVLPRMLARFVIVHQRGRARAGAPPLLLCDLCAKRAVERGLLSPEEAYAS